MSLRNHFFCLYQELIKKVITNLDSSKAPGPDCILQVVLKKCEPELSCILAEPFSDCWKIAFPVFKNLGKRSKAKNYCPV